MGDVSFKIFIRIFICPQNGLSFAGAVFFSKLQKMGTSEEVKGWL